MLGRRRICSGYNGGIVWDKRRVRVVKGKFKKLLAASYKLSAKKLNGYESHVDLVWSKAGQKR